MSTSTAPIPFYDLVAHSGAPLFSPRTIRARLGFALKGVPIETREVTYADLLTHLKAELNVDHATVPFIKKPDGDYLIDSFKICDWLEEAYPDRPSVYLPEAATPVDRTSAEYERAVDEAKGEWEKAVQPIWWASFYLYAPAILPTLNLSEEHHEYWVSDDRLGPGKWQNILDTPEQESIDKARDLLSGLAKQLSATQLFFSSATKPGLKDFTLMGPHRMLATTNKEWIEKTYVAAGLGEWLDRMHEVFAEELSIVVARDPK